MPLPPSLTQHMVRRPQRIALLQHVAEQGSITRAAKAAGLSYKAAWDAIDELNNLAGQPLVERAVGGKGGGGAHLSAEGERVLRLYQRLQTLQAELLASSEDGDFNLLSRLMLRTSARNQLHGRVTGIQAQGRNDLIDLQLTGAITLQARITHDSTQRLELEVGIEVFALIKANWLELQAPGSNETPGHNCLAGQIEALLPAEDGPAEVRISLPDGPQLCALADAEHLQSLGLSEGAAVQVCFAPANVLIGLPL